MYKYKFTILFEDHLSPIDICALISRVGASNLRVYVHPFGGCSFLLETPDEAKSIFIQNICIAATFAYLWGAIPYLWMMP